MGVQSRVAVSITWKQLSACHSCDGDGDGDGDGEGCVVHSSALTVLLH